MNALLEWSKRHLDSVGQVHRLLTRLYMKVAAKHFHGSRRYWEERYRRGMTSGHGSYNKLAEFKAEYLNTFVRQNRVASVIEFGCGDGNQLRLANYPAYVGFDVSSEAISRCRELFRADTTKTFKLVDDFAGEAADLALSLDVIYHLVEDEVFHEYMTRLMLSATRFVIIYSTDADAQNVFQAPHVRHRQFSGWISMNAPEWQLLEHARNPYHHSDDPKCRSQADFFVYCRKA